MRKVVIEDSRLENFLQENCGLKKLSLHRCSLGVKVKEGLFKTFGHLVELNLSQLSYIGDQGLCLLFRKAYNQHEYAFFFFYKTCIQNTHVYS